MKFNRLLALLLSAMLIFTTVAFVACNTDNESKLPDLDADLYSGNYVATTAKTELKKLCKYLDDFMPRNDEGTMIGKSHLFLSFTSNTNSEYTSYKGFCLSDGTQAIEQFDYANMTSVDNKEQTTDGKLWVDTHNGKLYVDVTTTVDKTDTKTKGAYSSSSAEWKTYLALTSTISLPDMVNQIKDSINKDTAKIYKASKNNYKVESTIDGDNATLYIYVAGKAVCLRFEVNQNDGTLILDARPTDQTATLPEDLTTFK